MQTDRKWSRDEADDGLPRVVGPVSVNYSELLGHVVSAEKYIAALVGSRGNYHPTFVACLPTDDLQAAIVAMDKVEAEYLVVLKGDVGSTLTADVIGVVTHGAPPLYNSYGLFPYNP